MTSEQIVMRQEIRQMLNEVGINKNTLKDMVKVVLEEELAKACKQAMQEYNLDSVISKTSNNILDKKVERLIREEIRDRVNGIFNRMTISVDITDKTGTSSLEK